MARWCKCWGMGDGNENQRTGSAASQSTRTGRPPCYESHNVGAASGFWIDRAVRCLQACSEIMHHLNCDGNDMSVLDDALRQIGFDCFKEERLI